MSNQLVPQALLLSVPPPLGLRQAPFPPRIFENLILQILISPKVKAKAGLLTKARAKAKKVKAKVEANTKAKKTDHLPLLLPFLPHLQKGKERDNSTDFPSAMLHSTLQGPGLSLWQVPPTQPHPPLPPTLPRFQSPPFVPAPTRPGLSLWQVPPSYISLPFPLPFSHGDRRARGGSQRERERERGRQRVRKWKRKSKKEGRDLPQ